MIDKAYCKIKFYLLWTKPLPWYPSDETPSDVNFESMRFTPGRIHSPEMGLILSSFARSLVASCHSLVMVFGAGGAKVVLTRQKK